MSPRPARVRSSTPFILAELMAWVRSLGPYRWTRNQLRDWGLTGRAIVTSVPYLWLLLFFAVPFLIVFKISMSEMRLGMPPYEPLYTWASALVVEFKVNLANYAFL